MKRLRLTALFLAILLIGYALLTNRQGYALGPNLAAFAGVVFALALLRSSGGSDGDR